MARPRQFDRSEVVDRATEVFWLKGYQRTSIQDLEEATRIKRGSLYHAFGDKAGLFAAVLERYGAISPARRLIEQAESGPPRETIEVLFAEIVAIGAGDHRRRGCLLTNTAVELSAVDAAVGEQVAESLWTIESALFRLIERGQARGEIARLREPHALARFLLAALQGLRVIAKVNPDRRALEDVAAVALAALGGERGESSGAARGGTSA